MLAFKSYRDVLKWSDTLSSSSPLRSIPVPVAVWSIKHAARLVPGALCLAQALSLRHLLMLAGEQCTVRIGASMKDDGKFAAHAWVLYQGRCIIGGTEEHVGKFSRLVDL